MSEPTVVYEGEYAGRLPRVNERLGTHRVGQSALIFGTTQFKQNKRDMAVGFMVTRPKAPIEHPVDARVEVTLWKRLDSDAPVKGIFDALEIAGVLKDDKLIRDFTIIRHYHHRDATDVVKVKLTVARVRE